MESATHIPTRRAGLTPGLVIGGFLVTGLLMLSGGTPQAAAPGQEAPAITEAALTSCAALRPDPARAAAVTRVTQQYAPQKTAPTVILGLALGITHAVGPVENAPPARHAHPPQINGNTATAVAIWRRCINEKAIDAARSAASTNTGQAALF